MIKRKYFFISGFLVVMLFAFFSDFREKLAFIQDEQSRLQLLSKQIELDKMFLRDYSQVQHKLFLLTHNVQSSYSVEEDITSLLFRIFSWAKLSNVQVKLINPHEIKNQKDQAAQKIELIFTGQLSALSALFYEMQQLPFIYIRLNLRREGYELWRMTVHLKAFVKKYVITSLEFKEKNLSLSNMLTLFPVEQLHYAGQIKFRHIQWALIRLPNTRTLAVKIGSIVGIEHQPIISIEDRAIVLKNQQEIVK